MALTSRSQCYKVMDRGMTMVSYIVDGLNCSRVIWKSDNTDESFCFVCNSRMSAEILERALKDCYHIETVEYLQR